jgi:hypothetical protein
MAEDVYPSFWWKVADHWENSWRCLPKFLTESCRPLLKRTELSQEELCISHGVRGGPCSMLPMHKPTSRAHVLSKSNIHDQGRDCTLPLPLSENTVHRQAGSSYPGTPSSFSKYILPVPHCKYIFGWGQTSVLTHNSVSHLF